MRRVTTFGVLGMVGVLACMAGGCSSSSSHTVTLGALQSRPFCLAAGDTVGGQLWAYQHVLATGESGEFTTVTEAIPSFYLIGE
ncbi:MAG: hypothetical protein IPK69_12795 [Phycisphaerales bacterium]|nr:MAG: hypothetical protein IPK69_12795 [Phycisphaerales bacterium]